jgi:hypothetical protein
MGKEPLGGQKDKATNDKKKIVYGWLLFCLLNEANFACIQR